MKCISVWQPWASLLVHGLKRCETRGWDLRYRGPLLIHAAKRKPDDDTVDLCHEEPFRSALVALGMLQIGPATADVAGPLAELTSEQSLLKMTLGAIVGCVQIDDCVPTSRIRFHAAAEAPWPTDGRDHSLCVNATERAFGDFGPGRFAWYCSRFMAFAEPVPYRGAQGLFDVPGDAVREAIESAKRRAAA